MEAFPGHPKIATPNNSNTHPPPLFLPYILLSMTLITL